MFLWDTIPPSWSPGFHIKSLFLDPTKQTNNQTKVPYKEYKSHKWGSIVIHNEQRVCTLN